MIDILELVPILPNAKQTEHDPPSKEQYFNEVFGRLRERNANNQNFIKRYIKKNKKKHAMLTFSLALRTETRSCTQKNEVKQVNQTLYSFHHHDNAQKQPIEAIKEEEAEGNELKQTNISENQHSAAKLQHIKTIPTLRKRQHTHKSNKKLTQCNPQVHLEKTKCQKEFTRYLRSFFLNKIVEKSRLKERQKQLELKSNAKSLNKGRVNTETSKPICCKLKVKSLIFGNLGGEDRPGSKKSEGNVRVHTQSYDNRYNLPQGQQKKLSKSILPTINSNISMKNRRCLQNYLRFHQQKVAKQKSQCFKITKLPFDNELVSATETINRKSILSKLSTLQVRKN